MRGDYFRGPGWYRRAVTWDPAWAGRRVYLQFDGANRRADAFINGRLVGSHLGGHARFRFDVTDALRRDGPSVLAVRVNNEDNDIIPHSGDFTFFGGIYRRVALLVADEVQIDLMDHASPGVYLRQDKVTAESEPRYGSGGAFRAGQGDRRRRGRCGERRCGGPTRRRGARRGHAAAGHPPAAALERPRRSAPLFRRGRGRRRRRHGIVTVSASTLDYTIGGAGVITAGSLAKSGAASLTLLGANTYAGGTTLSAGRIRLGADDALGSGAAHHHRRRAYPPPAPPPGPSPTPSVSRPMSPSGMMARTAASSPSPAPSVSTAPAAP